jgi:DNA-binding transcriptional MerR regulator
MRLNKTIEKKENEAVALYQNEAFDIGFYDYFKDLKSNKISQVLNSKERNVRFDSITYRQLNSWEKEGLLIAGREGREWRRFSIMEAIWVRLIKELRDFGLSREQVKVAKQSLEFESKKCGVAMPLLEFYTAFAIGNKMPVLLLVFKDGVAVPASLTQYKVAKEKAIVENHLQISLNDMLQGMFPELDLKAKENLAMPLHVEEMQLLAFMRLGDFEKVEVRYKDGRMDIIEGTERIATNKIAEIMKEQAYDEIKIRRQGGQVTSVLRTRKKKL